MKKLLSRTSRKIIESLLIFVVTIINLILMFSEVKNLTVFERGFLFSTSYEGEIIANIFFIVSALITITSILMTFLSKKRAYLIGLGSSLITSIVFIVLENFYSIFIDSSIVFLIIEIVLVVLGVAYYVLCLLLNSDSFIKNEVDVSSEIKKMKVKKVSKLFILILAIVCVISTLICLFIPLYSYQYTKSGSLVNVEFIPFSVITDPKNATVVNYMAFIALFALSLSIVGLLLSSLVYFKNDDGIFVNKAKKIINLNFAISIIYFIVGVTVSFFINQQSKYNVTTTAYVPFIIMAIVMILFAIASVELPLIEKKKTEKKFPKIEMLIYTFIFTIFPIVSSFVNFVQVKLNGETKMSLKLYDIIRDNESLGVSYQIISFFLIILSIVISCLLILTLASFFRNKSLFYKFSMSTILIDMLLVFAIGTFGLYYQIVQKMNEDTLADLFSSFGFSYTSPDYTVSSQTIYVFLIALACLIFVVIRNPLKDMPVGEFSINAINEQSLYGNNSNKEEYKGNNDLIDNVGETTFDACPAFSELDNRRKEFDLALEKRNSNTFDNLDLPSLTNFIVDYAKESRLHLSYSPEDIATFIAGLGATRLSILQGMSGNGKTSLPKIFIEAIMGNCEIIEVESSWRDKNELLGYYNEFSKTYTPKKFTQALYKAKLNPTVPTFIVLDEMNLSRIEYYFSDFLSLMENEEDKREIKLLNVKLYNTYDNEKHSYVALSDDHTIKIPTNVWFIGTANRDESTFEISDKVYDRAHTMNFNKRAPKAEYSGEQINQKFVPYELFNTLLKNAKNSYVFNIDDNEVIKEVEKILAPYNISFGNRISNQIESFVRIYCSCFENSSEREKEAVEKILLSKVVAKLENKSIENKEILINEFERLNLKKCAEFVAKLNED